MGALRLKGSIAALAATATTLALATEAWGAVTIGQTSQNNVVCLNNVSFLMDGDAPGPPTHSAPFPGVITAWAHETRTTNPGPATKDETLKLKVFRRTPATD